MWRCCRRTHSFGVRMIRVGFFRHGTRPGKHTQNYGKSPFFMGKSTISMAMFNSYVSHNQRVGE